MGTSTRKKIPRLADMLDNIEYDEDNNMSLGDFQKVLKRLLYPKGKSIQCKKIISNVTSKEFGHSIKKIIDFSKNYKSSGVAGFGIPGFNNYSFDEQVDLIADHIVKSEHPELKQSIKDIIYANGIDGTFNNTTTLIIEVLKKYLERSIQGNLVEEFAERNEEFTDKNFYELLSTIISATINKIITPEKVNQLVINYNDDEFITNWSNSAINEILEGIVI